MRKVVLASRNKDKVAELRDLLPGSEFEVVSSEDYPGLPEVIEDGTTILGNARRKAIVTAGYTGEIAVADDTSLEVRHLNGFPDIFAARFSGEGATYASNAELLLELMRDVPDGARQARFSTACVWVDPQPEMSEVKVLPPAGTRWLGNPWGMRPGHLEKGDEWDYWNSLADRHKAWQFYRRGMESDLASWGQDSTRLSEVARELFSGCPDALRPGEELNQALVEEGMKLPDSHIWTVDSPDDMDDLEVRFAPSGMPTDAPGSNLAKPCWLEVFAEGKILGEITRQPVGAGGFGYDPVFRPVGNSLTLAEMPAEDKHAISHRGRAMRRLLLGVNQAY